jgi:nucleotide-binding universal stress UspA family protein
MFKKILVAYDGSPHSQRALTTAVELARLTHASVQLLHAYDKIPAYLGEPNFQDMVDRVVIPARELVKNAADQVRTEGFQVTTNALEGPAAEAILNVAETEKFDLIVMGSRGLGQLQGLLIGSVSDRVIRHAHIPVLIVR